MIQHSELSNFALNRKIITHELSVGGNSKMKIYGTLDCISGKRMKTGNRVFFASEKKAISFGFRPCGHCMKPAYMKWKNGAI